MRLMRNLPRPDMTRLESLGSPAAPGNACPEPIMFLHFRPRFKGPPGQRIVQKTMHAFIYKNAHPCQDNFMRRFGSGRFFHIICAGKDERKRREAQAAIVLISISPAFFVLILFVFMCKCPGICFFPYRAAVWYKMCSAHVNRN